MHKVITIDGATKTIKIEIDFDKISLKISERHNTAKAAGAELTRILNEELKK